ncbi:MAG TPA: hypothetical protein VKR52_04780 [Terracidiphilus sp.]|nr:hypothetical protein [Terracidiphilus sp.]
MDQISEIILRLKISELEAQAVLRELERDAWNKVIDDPNTNEDDRSRASIRRDRTIIEWGEIMTELQELRDLQANLPELKPRGELN